MIATKIGELTPYQDSIYLNRSRIRKERFLDSHEHHIVPRCLFTEEDDFKESEENKTFLSFREHFIAHLLLHKTCPEHRGLLTAAALMLVTNPKAYLKTPKGQMTLAKSKVSRLKNLLKKSPMREDLLQKLELAEKDLKIKTSLYEEL